MNVRLFALALVLPATAGARDFSVEATPTGGGCPGPYDFAISGTAPNTRVALITAEGFDGGVTVPGCDFRQTEVGPGGLLHRTTVTTDAMGTYALPVMVPDAACGLHVQGVNLDSCAIGTAVELGGVAEALPCACGGDFSSGDRVYALVDSPSRATGIVAGDAGTVVAGRETGLPILVEWDAWVDGHAGNCVVADCGTCIDAPIDSRWWVLCDEVARPDLGCVEDVFEDNDTPETAALLTEYYEPWCGDLSVRTLEGQLCDGDDDYIEIPMPGDGTEVTVRALFLDAEGDIDLELTVDGEVVDRSVGTGDTETVSYYEGYTMYGCGWMGGVCPGDPILRVYLDADDGVRPGNEYILEFVHEDFYYPDYCY